MEFTTPRAKVRARNAEPPRLKKGSGRPVTGVIPIVMPMLMKTWNTNVEATPTAIKAPKRSRALEAMTRILQIRIMNANRRSEEHTSELQSRPHLVCRLLLEKKNKKKQKTT